ncbi:MAG: c-type cytochrome biogenesis protein CcmI [Burkholderiaceae bacterium]
MSTFLLVAAAMVVVAVASVLWPLLRPGRGPGVQRKSANASIYRDQFADLDADLARGTISPEKHAEARNELERRVLEDVTEQSPTQATQPRKWTAVAIAVVLPVAAALLYLQLGAVTDGPPQQSAADSKAPLTEQQIVEMVTQLAERLKKEPDNAEGWSILARSYYAMERYAESAAAFERLDTLRPNDPNILTDRADALAMSRNRDISGPPLALVERALKLDPKQGKALAIAGTAAFDRQDYAAAVSYWERLVATQAPDSDIAKTVQASIDEARSRGKLPAAGARVAAQPASGGTAKGKGAAVSGTVTLSPALASRATPTDTVFIYARAAEGGRMPLAIMRAQVKDLPLAFKLDDTLSMSPAAKISGVKDVVVTARVSRSGSATPQSGDLEGASAAVSVGTEALTIAIDRALP